MPFNLLLFPLVGGFYVITRLEYFKYINQRKDHQTVLFNSIIVGIPLLLISFVICTLATYFWKPQIEYVKINYFPIKDQYFGTSLISFVLALIIPYFGNKVIREQEAIEGAIKRIGNELERLFLFSFSERQLIQLTLSNGKVYIGWAEFLPLPEHSTYVRIIPALSGYRDERKELHVTTKYTEVYANFIRQGKITSIDELEMGLVIKVNEIITATRFDFDIFEKFEELSKGRATAK